MIVLIIMVIVNIINIWIDINKFFSVFSPHVKSKSLTSYDKRMFWPSKGKLICLKCGSRVLLELNPLPKKSISIFKFREELFFSSYWKYSPRIKLVYRQLNI